MSEVGTYPPPGITFGPISPIALLVFVTGLVSSQKAPTSNQVSDARWNLFVNTSDAIHSVQVVQA